MLTTLTILTLAFGAVMLRRRPDPKPVPVRRRR